MSDKSAVGVGVAFIIWGALLFMLNRPLGEAYRELWPNKYGEANKDRGWHRKELILIAVFLLVFGVAALVTRLR